MNGLAKFFLTTTILALVGLMVAVSSSINLRKQKEDCARLHDREVTKLCLEVFAAERYKEHIQREYNAYNDALNYDFDKIVDQPTLIKLANAVEARRKK